MNSIVLYAPEDQPHLERLLFYLQDAQGVEISDTAETALTDQPIRSVILLMSIDLLHRLVCETAYLALYRRLRLLEREGLIVIAYVRACAYPDHDTAFKGVSTSGTSSYGETPGGTGGHLSGDRCCAERQVSMKTRGEGMDKMRSADLRLRTSTTMWGPLQLTLTNHRQGSELGYEAGIAAYRTQCNRTVEELMHFYLETPRYRPRTCTQKIVTEWQAMFLLGWTSQLFQDMEEVRTNEPQQEYEAQSW